MRLLISYLSAVVLMTITPFVAADVRTSSNAYSVNEPIEVAYDGLPGNARDWITLVPKSSRDNYYREWIYTGGKRTGKHVFRGLPPGEYEVRVYHDWPKGKHVVQERVGVVVKPNQAPLVQTSSLVRTTKSSYQPNEPIEVVYEGLPGNLKDSITVVPRGSSLRTIAERVYTGGKQSGSHTFKGRPAGDYEVRVYFGVPAGNYSVQGRHSVSVTSGGPTIPSDQAAKKTEEEKEVALAKYMARFPGNQFVSTGDPPKWLNGQCVEWARGLYSQVAVGKLDNISFGKAENIPELLKDRGFTLIEDFMQPRVGAMIVWKDGAAGHVGVVTKVTIDKSSGRVTGISVSEANFAHVTDASAKKWGISKETADIEIVTEKYGIFTQSDFSIDNLTRGKLKFATYVYP